MAGQQHTGFETYPFDGEGERIADPDPAPPGQVTAYRAPQPTSPPGEPRGGIGRRALLGLIIAVPVAGAVGLAVSRSESGAATGEATASAVPGSGYLDVGGGMYTAMVPEGWELDGSDVAIVTRGNNRLLALDVSDDGSAEITDQLLDLVGEYRGTFKGALGEPVDTSSASVRRATLTADGTVGTDGARLRADLWIRDDEDGGLLVIQTLTARKGSRIAVESQSMADELSAGF